jgi:predicted RND superfamily exporter protein
MDKILRFLFPILRINYRHPFFVILTSLIIAGVATNFALKLNIDTDIANLLPSTHPNVQALDRLRETVGGETEMQVVINSPDFEANLAFAEAIIPKSMELHYSRANGPFFSRFEFRKETEVLKDYALYLATLSELDELEMYLSDEIEDAKLAANPFFVDFEEDFDDSEETEMYAQAAFMDAYRDLIPNEYPVNSDSTSLVIKFFPTGSRSDLRFLRTLFREYDGLIAEMNPQSYHPEMVVMAGGRLKRHLIEIDSIMNDVLSSFSTGISSVLLLVMLYFFWKIYLNYKRGTKENQKKGFLSHLKRLPISVVIIGLPLLVSLALTFGITYFVLGVLNTMTSVLFVILFGLGIDYGIHFYARYLEIRSSGKEVGMALEETYYSSGKAIMTSAATTAIALFVLIYADFRGFSEFGFISGMGIIFAFFSMLFLLPAFVVLFERLNLILINTNKTKTFLIKKIPKRYPYSKSIVTVGVLIIVFVLFNTDKITFEYNFSVLEPEFTEYLEFRELAGNATSSNRRNPAYIVADTYDEVDLILESIREIRERNAGETTILDVEALQERFPVSEEAEQRKLERLADIRALLQDPFIKDRESDDLERLRRASQATEPLSFELLPEYLTERFVTRDGEIGRFVMIYPSVGLADGRNSIAFKNEIGRVETSDGNVYYSASTSIVAASMLDLMIQESYVMVWATFIMILVMMFVSFRSFRWTIISMLPLVVGLSWLFFVMILFDLSFNFYNLVTIPAILGIGNDNGVHLASRYREEGRMSMWNVLSSTGQHISVGSITTMLGFAGLLFTVHPGLYSIGLIAVIGIGMTLLSAVTFLPALVQILEDKNWIRFD